jgi:integrase
MVKILVKTGGICMALMARNVYKRKDGRFEARYIRERDLNGRAVYGAVYAHSYAEVKTKLAAAQSGVIPKRSCSSPTIVDSVADHLEAAKARLKPSTLGVYRRYLNNYITPYFEDVRCDRLTTAAIQKFIDTQLSNGLSVITVKSVFSLLKAGVGVHSSVFGGAVVIQKAPKKETVCLSIAEQHKLETAANSSDSINGLAVTICLYTGIRIGEICGLMWDDIDFERKTLHIRRTMQRISGGDGDSKTQIAFLAPKSETSARSIPLPRFLVERLIAAKSECDCEYVLSRNGKPVEPRNIQYRFKQLLRKARLRDVNFHVLRHTFSTRALEQGFDVKSLSEILGHASATVTLKIYAHALDGQRRRCMESLSAVWESNDNSGQNSGQTVRENAQ